MTGDIPALWQIMMPQAVPNPCSDDDDDDEPKYPVRSLWELYMPHATPYAIPPGAGRLIRDKEMGAQKHKARPPGHRPPPVDGRTCYEMLPWGVVCNAKRKRGAVTTRICAVLAKGPANHSDIIACIGSTAEDRRAVRNGLRYLLDNEQIRRFLEDES